MKDFQSENWIEKSVHDFFELDPGQIAYVDLKLLLRKEIKKRRIQADITQSKLAKRMRSSQSRVAKIEGGDPAVTIDLHLRALFALGVSLEDLGSILLADTEVQEDSDVFEEWVNVSGLFEHREQSYFDKAERRYVMTASVLTN